ncbi:MAG: hypothetical protein ACC645_04295 [Pirellulales bacterium]
MVVVGAAVRTEGAEPEQPAVSESLGPLAERVRRLVEQLDDDRLAVRTQAEAELVRLGPRAADYLPEADDGMSAEVVHRLARVRNGWLGEQIKIVQEASKITWPDGTIRLAELLELVQKQTGNQLRIREEIAPSLAERMVKVEAGSVDFWPAIDRVLDQVGLTPYHFSRNQELLLMAVPESQVARYDRALYCGPFRLEPVRLEAHRDLRSPVTSRLTLHVEIAWEPRLTPIGVNQPLADVDATGDGGIPLRLVERDLDLSPVVHQGTTAVDLEIPFQLPPRRIKQIAVVRGKLSVLLPGVIQALRFEQLEAGGLQQRQEGDVTVLLEGIRRNGQLWEIRLRVRFAGADEALDSHRGWLFRNACFLVDQHKKRYEHAGFETTRQNQGEVGIAYLFDVAEDLAGLTLVYETPVSILQVPVEYELRNIPLP